MLDEQDEREPKEESRTCDTCCWWDDRKAKFDRKSQPTKHSSNSEEGYSGLCRLKPPNCVVTHRDVFWPMTLEKDWCSKYRAKLDNEALKIWKDAYLKAVN